MSLLVIFNTRFWVYANFFHEKTDKPRKYSKSAIFVWHENGRRRLLGAQSINTEKSSLRLRKAYDPAEVQSRSGHKSRIHAHQDYSLPALRIAFPLHKRDTPPPGQGSSSRRNRRKLWLQSTRYTMSPLLEWPERNYRKTKVWNNNSSLRWNHEMHSRVDRGEKAEPGESTATSTSTSLKWPPV